MIARSLLVAAALLSPGMALAAGQPHSAPPPPSLVSPPDDSDLTNCLPPDPKRGLKLDWRAGSAPGQGDLPLTSYLEIRRLSGSVWSPWLKRFVKVPPFYLNATSDRVYDATFAWRVWTVDRSGTLQPYAAPSGWWLFCTLPRNGDGKAPPADVKAPPAEEGAGPAKAPDE